MLHTEDSGTVNSAALMRAEMSQQPLKKKRGAKAASFRPENLKGPPVSLPEIRTLMLFISGIAWINLLIGMASIALYPWVHNFSLLETGILSAFTFALLRFRVQDVREGADWIEVCITAIGGIYFPTFVLWVSIINLYTAIALFHQFAERTLVMYP